MSPHRPENVLADNMVTDRLGSLSLTTALSSLKGVICYYCRSKRGENEDAFDEESVDLIKIRFCYKWCTNIGHELW